VNRGQLKTKLREIGLSLSVDKDEDTPCEDFSVIDAAGDTVAFGTTFDPSELVGAVLSHPVVRMKLEKGRAA
jgi:hypothetical protein